MNEKQILQSESQNEEKTELNIEDLQVQLYLACEIGDVDQVKQLLANSSIDVNYPIAVKELADPNAAGTMFAQYFEKLLFHPNDPNYKSEIPYVTHYFSPLYIAAKNNHVEVVKLLIDVNADPNEKGYSPLFIATKQGHHNVVEILLNKLPAKAITAEENLNEETPLSIACTLGYEKIMKLFVEHKADINKPLRISFFTPLHLACKHGHFELAELLISNHANVHVIDLEGNNALHYACLDGNLNVVKLLLNNGINLNLQNTNGCSPLYFATGKDHADIVSLLIEAGANINIQAKNGPTSLLLATQLKTNIAKILINAGADIDISSYSTLSENDNGEFPLLCSAMNNNLELVKVLLNKQAKMFVDNSFTVSLSKEIISLCSDYLKHKEKLVKIRTTKEYPIARWEKVLASKELKEEIKNSIDHKDLAKFKSLLNVWEYDLTHLICHAVSEQQYEMVKLLLTKNPDLNILIEMQNVDLSELSPLHLSVVNDDLAMVHLLLEHGADINIKGKDTPYDGDKTPLHFACQFSRNNIAEVLLRNNAGVNLLDKRGFSALHYACLFKNEGLAKLLLSFGADVNLINKKGETALHFAVRQNQPELLKLLLQNGAKVDLQNDDGDTPLCKAATWGFKEIAKLLIEEDADINLGSYGKRETPSFNKGVTAPYYFTPLCFAAQNGHLDIINLLLQRGAKINTENLVSPLFMAVQNHYIDIASTLIKAGANVNANVWSIYPIIMAVINADKEMLTLLIEAGADVNVSDDDHGSLLHYAVIYGYSSIVELLLKYKADANLKDYFGRDPIDLGIERNNTEILQSFRNAFENSSDSSTMVLKQKINDFFKGNGTHVAPNLKRLLSFLKQNSKQEEGMDDSNSKSPKFMSNS